MSKSKIKLVNRNIHDTREDVEKQRRPLRIQKRKNFL